jgi:isopentenyldiphosphate isomerase
MNEFDELLDSVDQNDHVIGTILRNKTTQHIPGFLRAAEAFIQNKDGQLWIPRRQMHKRIAPGGLDYSMGEHVMAGETYLQAAVRGFLEELNTPVKSSDLQFIHKFKPIENLDYFRSLYIYKSDISPQYNPEDFTGFEWLTAQQLLKRLKNGEPAKRSLAETVSYLIQHNQA